MTDRMRITGQQGFCEAPQRPVALNAKRPEAGWERVAMTEEKTIRTDIYGDTTTVCGTVWVQPEHMGQRRYSIALSFPSFGPSGIDLVIAHDAPYYSVALLQEVFDGYVAAVNASGCPALDQANKIVAEAYGIELEGQP